MLGIHSLVEVVIDALIESYHSKNKIYENVYCDEQLLQQLLEYLETYNYPIECFDLHFPVTKYFKYYAKKMTPDLTVLNVDTMEPLAFFKVIDDLDNLPKENFLDDAYHMNKHTKILLHIPYYIVTKNVSSGSLEFLNLIMILRKWSYNNLSENSRSIALKAPYKYEILQANNRNRNYYTKIIKKRQTNKFRTISILFSRSVIFGNFTCFRCTKNISLNGIETNCFWDYYTFLFNSIFSANKYQRFLSIL